MIRHLFKMIWNQKGRNFGLILEIFFSFMVLFGVLTFVIQNIKFYQEPLGFHSEPIWVLRTDWKGAPAGEVRETMDQIKRELNGFPQIESFTLSSGNIPYANSMMSTSITHEGVEAKTYRFVVDENFAKTLDIELKSGRWLQDQELHGAYRPIVINQMLKDKLFPNSDPVGQYLSMNEGEEEQGQKTKIVGLIGNYKYRGEFSGRYGSFFELSDTSDLHNRMMLKMNARATAQTEEQIVKRLNLLAPNWAFEIEHNSDMRRNMLKITYIPMIILGIVIGFLIFNVALGLFGVLWYNINKRKAEIGIRRALGATKDGVRGQFIGEVLVLATFSLALGVFFAIQFPILQVFGVSTMVYLLAILSSIVLIYGLVVLCSFYPSQMAAQLQPATALHED